MFVADGLVTNNMTISPSINAPKFSLWQYNQTDQLRNFSNLVHRLNAPFNYVISHKSGTVGLVEVSFTSNNSFKDGDFLGLMQQNNAANLLQCCDIVSHSADNGIANQDAITILRQEVGYDTTNLVRSCCECDGCTQCQWPSHWNSWRITPYVAVETDPPGQQCTKGFLSSQSLKLIIDAARNCDIYRSLHHEYWYYSANKLLLSKPLNQTGFLRKWIMALHVYANEPLHLPLMWIIRPGDEASKSSDPQIIFSNNNSTMKPKPTGYLNVYEYDLPSEQYKVQSGDVLKIIWNTTQPNSLAYYQSSNEEFPLVSIIVGDHDCEAYYLNLSSVYCSDITGLPTSNASFSTVTEERDIETSNQSVMTAVMGGIVSSTILSIVLIILLIIVVIIIKQRRKLTSTPFTTTESSRSEINQGSSSGYVRETVASGENAYVLDNQLPPNAQEAVTNQENPQNDYYYYYKLCEWGVFVPTVDQRGKIASTANNDDNIYSSLGESQYSKLQQFNRVPEFFENCSNYWKPASDTEGLYQQLSSKKYREILRQQIRYIKIVIKEEEESMGTRLQGYAMLSDSLGSGQFGNVMKGVWLLSGGSKEVAVKMLKEEASETEKVRFLQEAAINGQFWHPNVVKLMGVVTIGEPVMIVLEFLSNGDLRGYLIKMQPTPGEMVPSNTPHTLLRFCKEIAAGMKYLAGKGFVHRDLAARNILVSEEKTCKISDFGMSRDLENESYYISHGGMIPVKWTAPEALHYKKYSTLSDVWSFGCVVYEIWSLGHKPFEEYSKQEVIRKVDSGFRLPPPPGCPRDIYHIMIQCWHPNKNLRPSFSDIHTSLSDHILSLGMKESQSEGPDRPLPLHPQAHTIGAPLEAGKQLFADLQKIYINV